MTIRVSYDSQIFRLQRVGGVSRYFTELIFAFHSETELGVSPALPARFVPSNFRDDTGRRRVVIPPRAFDAVRTLLPASTRRLQQSDIVHHTYYLPRELRSSWRVPRVTTIHDMIPELMPEYFPDGNPHQAKRSYVEESSGLVFVSETSKRDLLRIFGAQDIPMAVAHLAPGRAFRQRRTAGVQNDRFVIFVGSRSGYKDFGTLLTALAETQGLSLIAVGGGALSAAERRHIDEFGLIDRVHQVAVSDEALAKLYSAATALVIPSRYEGFGLPIAEAMSTGCPVLASDIDVFHEVADEAAEYFEVGNAAALAAGLQRVCCDESLRRARRDSGILRAKDFTWSKTARVTAELYREVLQHRSR